MKVSDIQQATKILNKISNQSSISELFRCVELTSNGFRTCSEYGNCEVWIDLPIQGPLLINTAAFTSVINSLPSSSDIEFRQTNEKLSWSSGSAKGHWALNSFTQSIPLIPSNKDFTWIPSSEFADALDLASSACQSMTVSIGLFGVIFEVVDNRLRLSSSNSISLATSSIPLDGYPIRETITIRPPIPSILSMLLKENKEMQVAIDKDGIYCLSKSGAVQLPLSPPLELSLGDVIAKYQNAEHIAKIEAKAISQFLNRAKALSDKNLPVEVSLQVSQGKLLLEQKSAASSSEEYFLCQGIDPSKTFDSVVLPLNLMQTSLGHATEAVLDHLGGNVLVLRGEKPQFMHIVGGKSK